MTNSRFDSLLSESILEYGETYIEIPEEMWAPHKFSRSFERRMRRLIRRQRRKEAKEAAAAARASGRASFAKSGKFWWRMPMGRRVAIFALILIGMSFMVTNAGASQNFIPGYIIDDLPKFSYVSVDPDTFAPDASDRLDEFYELTWVPSGYVLTEVNRSEFWNSMTYENEDGSFIDFDQNAVVNYRAGLNTEFADMEYIRINDCDGFTIVDRGDANIVWHDGKNIFDVTFISGDQIDRTGVALLAKSVQKVESE